MMQRHIGETDSTVIEKQKGDTVHIKTLILLIGLGLVYCLPLFFDFRDSSLSDRGYFFPFKPADRIGKCLDITRVLSCF